MFVWETCDSVYIPFETLLRAFNVMHLMSDSKAQQMCDHCEERVISWNFYIR